MRNIFSVTGKSILHTSYSKYIGTFFVGFNFLQVVVAVETGGALGEFGQFTII